MKLWGLAWVAFLSIVLLQPVASQRQVERTGPPSRETTIYPGALAAGAVARVSMLSRVPIGFEINASRGETVAVDQPLDIRRLDAPDALEQLLGPNGAVYQWNMDGRVLDVRPAQQAAPSFLERRMPWTNLGSDRPDVLVNVFTFDGSSRGRTIPDALARITN